MNIAVVGGGTACLLLLEMIEKKAFPELQPKVVAVADIRDDAPGLLKAKEHGIFVTRDYNDLFDRDDIEFIIELTGNQMVFSHILSKKKQTVRAIDHRTSKLFFHYSMSRGVPSIPDKTKYEFEKTRTMYEVAINDLIQDDVMIIGLYYGILDINDSMLRKLGFSRDEVIGRQCHMITHHRKSPCGGEEHPCPLTETLNTKKPFSVTHTHYDKDNKELYYSISCYPILDNGEVIGAVEVSKDITKEVNFQKMLMQRQKLVSLGQLAAGVAHEINNPLTTILTTAMLMQEDMDPDDPRYQEFQTITNETLRCRKIVTSLLNFARQTHPTLKEHDINDIVQESIRLTRKQAAFKDVALEGELSENIPRIRVDKDQIQQSLINLALNAVEATDSGGKVTFTTGFISKDKMVEIAVSDTGKGIPEEDLDHIFEPFFSSKESGTGLGLAITHGIIQQHRGTIDVKSRPGQGTTFTIRLPITKGDKDAP
jgi:two-component system NtrC family sensor kinase